MYCARIVVFILLFLGTAASVCSYFFPLYTASKGQFDGMDGYYWKFIQKSASPSSDNHYLIINPRTDFTCKERRLAFIVDAAVSTAGMAFGLMATLCAAAHIPTRRPNGLAAGVFICGILALICQVLTVLVSVWPFIKNQCKKGDNINTDALKDLKFKLVHGFGISVAAAALYLIAFITEFFACQNIYTYDYE